MKIKHLNNSIICIIFLFLSGCVGPWTQTLYEKTRHCDPEPERYLVAFVSDHEIFIKYTPSSPSNEHEVVVSTEYWAVLPINELYNDVNYTKRKGWDIYRNGAPSDLQSKQISPIQIIDMSDLKIPMDKKEEKLTYIVKTLHCDLPVIIDKCIITPRIINGHYRCYFDEPKDNFVDHTGLLLNSWKYPFYMTGDYLFMPLFILIAGGWAFEH